MSSSLQQQDLVIFNDNSVFSEKLFQDYNSSTLITHVQGTSDSWLITGLIENLLVGSCYINNKTTGSLSTGSSYNIRSNPRSNVIFGSFMNNAQFYNKNLVKFMKMDITNTARNNCFKFVDLMDYTINNHTESVSEIFKPIHEQIKLLKSNSSHNNDTHKKINIIIEAPEILLQVKEDASAIDLIRELHLLQKLGNVILSISSDEPLIDYSEFESDVSTKHAVLLSSLIHKSNLLISLRPLSTGRADDITGELKIHKACVGLEDGLEIIEKSYLYNINKESTVKLFFK